MKNNIKTGKNFFIHSRAYVAGDVTLGENANVWCGACIRGDQSPIIIGNNTNVQGLSIQMDIIIKLESKQSFNDK